MSDAKQTLPPEENETRDSSSVHGEPQRHPETDGAGHVADGSNEKRIPPKRWLRIKWKRRIAWTFALLFGVAIFHGVYDRTRTAPATEIDLERQKALRLLIPIPAASVLPLNASWLPPDSVPYPTHVKEQPIPKAGAPRILLLPVKFTLDFAPSADPAKEQLVKEQVKVGEALARGLEALLRRDLDLVDGVSVFDAALTPTSQESLSSGALCSQLAESFGGLDMALRLELLQDALGLQITSAYLSLQPNGVLRYGPRERVAKDEVTVALRNLIRDLLPRLGGTCSDEAVQRIQTAAPSIHALRNTGEELASTPAGQLPTGYQRNALLAVTQLRTMPPAEASVALQSVIANDPNYVEGHWRLEWALPEDSGHEAGIEHCERALKLSPHCGPARLRLSARLLAQGQLEPALKHGLTALALMPPSPAAHTNLARIYLQLNAPETARQYAQKALALKAGFAAGHEVLLDALIALDQLTEALQKAEAYANENPANPDAFAYRIRALRLVGQFRQASELVEKAPASLLPEHYRNLLLAENRFWLGEMDAARATLDKNTQQRVRVSGALELERLLKEAGAGKTAVQHRQTPSSVASFRVLNIRAGVNHRLGRASVFRSVVNEMKALAPDDPQTLRWRLRLLVHHGQRFECLEPFEKLIAVLGRLRPEDVDDYVEALISHARFNDANQALHEHLKDKEDQARLMRLSARIAMAEGTFFADRLQDYDHALTVFNQALRRDKRVECMRQVVERAERYMQLLAKAGRIEDAKRVPARVNGPMDQAHKKALADALQNALARAPNKK